MIFGIRGPKSSRSSTPFTFALLFGQRFSIPLRAGDRYTGVQEPAWCHSATFWKVWCWLLSWEPPPPHDSDMEVAASIYPANNSIATWATFSVVAISLSSGIWTSLVKTSLTEFGIHTFLTPSPILIVNAVFVGWGCAFGCDAVEVC